jgi:hypothetical protein
LQVCAAGLSLHLALDRDLRRVLALNRIRNLELENVVFAGHLN